MSHTFTYRIRVWAIPSFIVLYFCIAGIPALFYLGSGGEKYLAYHFFVFTEVPSREQVTYAVYVTGVKGETIKPVQIQDADTLLADEWRNRPEYARRIEEFGRELSREVRGGDAQHAFEDLITVRPLSYEIREIRYNPIKRYLAGEIISERVIGSFTVK